MGTPATDAAKAAGAAAANSGGPGSANNGQSDALKKAYDWGFNSTKKTS